MIKDKILLVYYYIETRITKLLRLFNIRYDKTIIPKGQYCYEWDIEKNKNEPCKNGGYWIKTCKYYRSTYRTKGVACTYTGYYGFEPCLYDQCKICGVNDEIDECDLN